MHVFLWLFLLLLLYIVRNDENKDDQSIMREMGELNILISVYEGEYAIRVPKPSYFIKENPYNAMPRKTVFMLKGAQTGGPANIEAQHRQLRTCFALLCFDTVWYRTGSGAIVELPEKRAGANW